MPISLRIVYNLTTHTSGLHLPAALIVEMDASGQLTHVKQRATPETVAAVGLVTTAQQQRLFTLMEQLAETAIIAHFYRGRAAAPDLTELVADRTVRQQVQRYVDHRLAEWLQIIVQEQLPLCWQVTRRVLIKDFLLQPVAEPLVPHLHFVRTAEGITYRLQLVEDGQPWSIHTREVTALTNRPGWLVADDRLYTLDQLNGWRIKPFRQQESVFIPADKAVEYFRKVILHDIARDGTERIDTEGFAVEAYQGDPQAELVVQQHPFSGHYLLQLYFNYGEQARFGWNEQRQERTTLRLSGDDISIQSVSRDRAIEQRWQQRLTELGLSRADEGAYWYPAQEAPDQWTALDWLVQHHQELVAAAVTVASLQIDGQAVVLESAHLQISATEQNDWLDLTGEVAIGDHRIPLHKLIPYLRRGERLYALPDATWLLLPAWWFERYGPVVRLVEVRGARVQLSRANGHLLGPLLPSAHTPVTSSLEHQPSSQLRATLRPYQLAGFQWLVGHYEQQLGACLADDMGLGKTLQTIALLLHARERREHPVSAPVVGAASQLDLFSAVADADFLRPLQGLVILPASLVFNWENELRTFAPHLSVYQHTGTRRHRDIRLLGRFDLVLTTYQTALRDVKLLQKLEWEYIVLDESQQIKNPQSKVFKAINELKARHRVALSGTPIENSLADLWAQMEFLNPGLLRSYRFFRKEFIQPIEKQGDEARKASLRQLVQPYLLRRTKEEVAPDLPPLETHVYYCDMPDTQRREYERELSAARNQLLGSYDPQNAAYRLLVIQTLTRLRQLANHPALLQPEYTGESGKFNEVWAQWEQVQRSGHKVLLFSSFVQHLHLYGARLGAALHPYAWLTGEVPTAERQQQVARFQQEAEVQAFLISLKAGGTGLNLTAADYVFLLDPWWNPEAERQAIARAHRIGQERPVIAIKFITHGTIEEKILRLQERKTRLAADILDTEAAPTLDREELAFILE